MKLIFVKIDDILDNLEVEFLKNFAQKSFKSERKLIEHSIGRFLLDYGFKNFYDIQMSLNSKLFFSL